MKSKDNSKDSNLLILFVILNLTCKDKHGLKVDVLEVRY